MTKNPKSWKTRVFPLIRLVPLLAFWLRSLESAKEFRTCQTFLLTIFSKQKHRLQYILWRLRPHLSSERLPSEGKSLETRRPWQSWHQFSWLKARPSLLSSLGIDRTILITFYSKKRSMFDDDNQLFHSVICLTRNKWLLFLTSKTTSVVKGFFDKRTFWYHNLSG